MKKTLIILVLFFFSLVQAQENCMSDDDLMDFTIITYMEQGRTAMDVCTERVPNYDYTIYKKFVVQFKDLTHTSDKYLNAFYKSRYGNQWKQKKKDDLEIIVNEFKTKIEKKGIQNFCEGFNNGIGMKVYISESTYQLMKVQEEFIEDMGHIARESRYSICCIEKELSTYRYLFNNMPVCSTDNSYID